MKGCRLVALVGIIAALGWWAGASAQSGRRYIEPSLASGTGRPFSGGVLVGDTFYLSGTLGLEANRRSRHSRGRGRQRLQQRAEDAQSSGT